MAAFRQAKEKLDRLSGLEAQLDEKDKMISDLKKQVMQQESSIQGWLETIDQKKKIIREKEQWANRLEEENGSLVTKNAESARTIEKLQHACHESNAKLLAIEGNTSGLTRMNQSLTAQVQDLENQMKNTASKEKQQDERITGLVKELADERLALSES